MSFFFDVSISCFIHSVYYTRVDKECQAYTDINLFGIDCNYVEFLPETERLKDNTLRITKTPLNNPNYFIDDYQREGDNYNIPNTKSVHYKSWELINKIIGNVVNITNYNKTDKLDKIFKRINEYKGFKF